jgi:hypothetical protein
MKKTIILLSILFSLKLSAQNTDTLATGIQFNSSVNDVWGNSISNAFLRFDVYVSIPETNIKFETQVFKTQSESLYNNPMPLLLSYNDSLGHPHQLPMNFFYIVKPKQLHDSGYICLYNKLVKILLKYYPTMTFTIKN